MQKTMKRTLALILALVLSMSGLPFSAFATEALPDEPLSSQAPPSEAPVESSQSKPSGEPTASPAPDVTASPSPEESPEPGQSEEPSPTPETGPAPGAIAEPSASPEPAATSVFETELSTVEARQVWPALQRAKARAVAGVGTAGVLQMGYYCFPIDNPKTV
jgi:hypothetical protein